MTIQSIKEAIIQLSDEERGSLASWIIAQAYDRWDKEMVKDFSPGGRGDHLVAGVRREVREGKFSPLEEGLQTRRKQP